MSEAADIAGIVTGALAVIIAMLALFVSRTTLQQQQKTLKQQTYLQLSNRWDQGYPMRRPIKRLV